MKTYSPKPEHIQRRWYVMDASEQVLGRIATEAAHVLRGKHKPIYAPHADVGDHVIIVNAAKVVLTGGKERTKVAYRHSGHPGGITATVYEDLLAHRPAFAVEKAVRGMLPKNRLGRSMFKKLHVEAGPEHRHQAQQPESWAIGNRPAWEGLPTPTSVAPPPADSAGAEAKEAEASERPAPRRKSTATTTAPAATTAARKSTAKKPTATRKTTVTRKTAAARKTTGRATSTARKTTATKKTTARTPRKDGGSS
jgi:large subunit ribosomal protein L13